MKTPYKILDVDCDANDEEIKLAYLKQVKENPPDRDQEHFQQIHGAYLLIKDYNSRTRYALFSTPVADFDELIDQALRTDQDLVVDSLQFNKLLRASIDETTIQNAMRRPAK